jgi:flagellin
VGKDDPAGLIASEVLRADITSTQQAIANTERANQVIATADSALGQVSSLLNDIRGLVVEAANDGAMSEDQIAANQLQVDSSLEAINRIAQSTSFQGRNLLDGSLDFLNSAATITSVEDIQITNAMIGSAGQVAIDVDISQAAAKAQITGTGFTTAAAATATVNFAYSTSLTSSDVAAGKFTLTSKSLTDTTAYKVTITAGGGLGTGAVVTGFDGTNIAVTTEDGVAMTQDIVDAINDYSTGNLNSLVHASVNTDAAWVAGDDGFNATVTASSLAITAASPGAAFNNVAVSFETSSSVAANAPTVVYDSTLQTLTITVHDDAPTLLSDIASAFTSQAPEFTALAGGTGSGTISGAEADVDAIGSTGTSGGALLNDDLVLQVTGKKGMQVFSFGSGTGANMVASAINLVSDGTGVTASVSGNTLTLNSSDYGSKAYVGVEVISEGSSGTFGGNLSAVRDTGDDIQGTINGIVASGNGNEMSINTSTLGMKILVSAGSSTNFDFNITGGGALFQIGPDVATNQQARIGIQSVNSAKLGGAAGRLYELGSGQSASLGTDATKASEIVDEVITKIASLRGRLGAFQKATLDVNIASLTDTLENLTAAESIIRDADFAAETAELTRSQILVQSGTSVLSIANSNPQNILALLR